MWYLQKNYRSKIHSEDGKCIGLCGMGLLNDGSYKPRTQGQWLRDVRGSIVSGYNDCCDGKSDENGVTPRETRLLRGRLEQ